MPDFASQEYWQQRFTKNQTPFDWLLPAKTLSSLIQDSTDAQLLPHASILHVGCGTAESSALCKLVESPDQIHNVDYSQAAIDASKAREQERLKEDEPDLIGPESKHDSIQEAAETPEPPKSMKWSCLDLLSLDSTLDLLDERTTAGALYDLVVDKSTSDSIACGINIPVNLPYQLSIDGWTRGTRQSGVVQSAEVYPLHVLAVHLAALTKPRTGKWIVVSYSDDRFPFFPPYPHSASQGFLPKDVIQAGFPHPNQLWRLQTKEKIDLQSMETLAERKRRLSTSSVHRPELSHWLYVLVRTDAWVTD